MGLSRGHPCPVLIRSKRGSAYTRSRTWLKIKCNWLDARRRDVEPRSVLGQALGYLRSAVVTPHGVPARPANGTDQQRSRDLNRLGAFMGLMSQSDGDGPPDENPSRGDRITARRYGRRVALVTRRLLHESDYSEPRIGEEYFRKHLDEFKAEVGE